jgi:hypothetical protein
VIDKLFQNNDKNEKKYLDDFINVHKIDKHDENISYYLFSEMNNMKEFIYMM